MHRIGWDLEPPEYPGARQNKEDENTEGLDIPPLKLPEANSVYGIPPEPDALPSSIARSRSVSPGFFEAMKRKVMFKGEGEAGEPEKETTIREKLEEVKESARPSVELDLKKHLEEVRLLKQRIRSIGRQSFSGIDSINKQLDMLNNKLVK